MRDRSEQKSRSAAPEEGTAPAGERPQAGASAEPAPEREATDPPLGADAGSERVRELAAELDSLRDRYLRTMAEFENFRRRTERERSEGGAKAQAQVVEKLLDALDDLQRVAHYGADTTTVETLLEGVQMVERKLLRTLEGAGLEKMNARGEVFDPTLHEAIMTAPAESHEEDETVGEVFQPGYQFRGILLRPARVQVKKYGD